MTSLNLPSSRLTRLRRYHLSSLAQPVRAVNNHILASLNPAIQNGHLPLG